MTNKLMKFNNLNLFLKGNKSVDFSRRYRKTFSISEMSLLCFDFCFQNLSVNENWPLEVNAEFIYINGNDDEIVHVDSFKEIISINDQIIHFVRDFTLPNTKTWQGGTYYLRISTLGQTYNSALFNVIPLPVPTITSNSFFTIRNVRLFRIDFNNAFEKVKQQYAQFEHSNTQAIEIEMHLCNELHAYASKGLETWNCEIFIDFYTLDEVFLTRQSILQLIKKTERECIINLSLDLSNKEIWRKRDYYAKISFMDLAVAHFIFSLGDKDDNNNFYLDVDANSIAKNKGIAELTRTRIPFRPFVPNVELEEFPEKLRDEEAVKIAYKEELSDIDGYITEGLSVVVVCEKILSSFIYDIICKQTKKTPILDNLIVDAKDITVNIQNLKENDLMVLRSLEVFIDWPIGSSVLFQPDNSGNLPQIIAFCDPSVPLKEVLRRRFSVLVRIQGIPRTILVNGQPRNPLPYLITSVEKSLFKDFDSDKLYKQISGLNVIQFRKTFGYLQSKYKASTNSHTLFETIRLFKQNSNSTALDLPNVSFEDIGGYDEVKKKIKTFLSLFQKAEDNLPSEIQRDTIPKGFILHGDPGTGKTMFAKAIANELNATIQMVSGPEIVEMWVGKSEENLRNIFATARRNVPSVILFDEFDSIAGKRSDTPSGSAMVANSMMAQLLTELDGFQPIDGVIVIGTTNRIKSIDNALMRPSRLRPIHIGLPDLEARKMVASKHAEKFGVKTIIETTISLCLKYYEEWLTSDEDINARKIPSNFFEAIYREYPSYEKRMLDESFQLIMEKEILELFEIINRLNTQDSVSEETHKVTGIILQKFEGLLKKVQISNGKSESFAPVSWEKTEFEEDLEDVFHMIKTETMDGKKIIEEEYFNFLMDVIAQFTDTFNNDELGSLFKEAIIDHSMEGIALTPRYFGEKIGSIKSVRETKGILYLY